MVAHLDAVTCLSVDSPGLYLLSGSKYCSLPKAGEKGGGGGDAKYLGPGLVGGGQILVKRLVIGATVKRTGGS